MRRTGRSPAGGLASAITLIGLVLAFTIHPFNLPIFFVAIALATFIGALGTLNLRRIYGAIYSSMWMLILALFFLTYSWIWFLVGAAISALLGAFLKSIVAWFLAAGAFGLSAQTPPLQQQPYYTPPPTVQPQQEYQQGYQATPAPPPETYREGEKQYYYPPQPQQSSQQYDSPQSQYPQQMPPQ